MGAFADLDRYDGLGLAELVRKGEVRSSELVEEAISRIETRPQINAIVFKTFESARAAAAAPSAGPVAGVPFLLKDMSASVAGAPMSCGNRVLAKIILDHDDESVRRYKGAGLIILGKTREIVLSRLVARHRTRLASRRRKPNVFKCPVGFHKCPVGIGLDQCFYKHFHLRATARSYSGRLGIMKTGEFSRHSTLSPNQFGADDRSGLSQTPTTPSQACRTETQGNAAFPSASVFFDLIICHYAF